MRSDRSWPAQLLDSLSLDHDAVVDGWLERYGEYRLGHFESDPDLAEYEELVALGQSLGAHCR